MTPATGKRGRWPKEAQLVICGECTRAGSRGTVLIELTGTDKVIYPDGVIEYPGVDVEFGGLHHALNPRPLTPTARAMLAIAKAGRR